MEISTTDRADIHMDMHGIIPVCLWRGWLSGEAVRLSAEPVSQATGGSRPCIAFDANRNFERILSLETKVPTIWTDEKQHSQEEAEPGRNSDV